MEAEPCAVLDSTRPAAAYRSGSSQTVLPTSSLELLPSQRRSRASGMEVLRGAAGASPIHSLWRALCMGDTTTAVTD